MATKKSKGTKKSSPKKTDSEGGIIFKGNAKIGGDVIGRDQVIKGTYNRGNTTNIVLREKLFEEILSKIEKRPNTSLDDKADLKANVEEIKVEAAKGNKADETFLARRFRNIMRMAPDILEVVTATLVNPAAGFAKVVEKVAKKAAESNAANKP